MENGPQNRGFSVKNIDFQLGNERLKTFEHLFKIDHRNFQMCHFETGLLQKKVVNVAKGNWVQDDARTDIYDFSTHTDLKSPRAKKKIAKVSIFLQKS